MFEDKLEKEFKEFLELLTFLKPWEIIGVAKILKVDILTEEVDENGHHLPKEFFTVYEEMMDNFCSKRRKERKELLEIMRAAKEQQHADESVD